MDPRKSLPSHPSYSYFGNNSSFHFVHPGEYSIRMAMPSTITPVGDQQQTFNTTSDITTHVYSTTPKHVAFQNQRVGTPIPGSPAGSGHAVVPRSPFGSGHDVAPRSPFGNASVKSEHSQSSARSVSVVEVPSMSPSQTSAFNSGLTSGNDGLPFFPSPRGQSQ